MYNKIERGTLTNESYDSRNYPLRAYLRPDAAVSLSLFAGIISAFVDNVATVLMIVPAYILIWILFGV